MPIEDQIQKINSAFSAKQDADAKASKERSEALTTKQNRIGVLKTEGPQFITALHNLLNTRATGLSQKIQDPALRMHVNNGSSSRQVVLSAGGRPLPNQIRYPCAFVALTDQFDRIIKGTAQSEKMTNQEEMDWEPKDGKVQILKNGKPQSLPELVDEIIESFLALVVPGGR